MTFDDLLPPVTDLGVDFDTAMSSWRWLIEKPVKPLLLTALGDLFVEAVEGIFFLDTAKGTFSRVANSRAEWKELLQNLDCLGSWFSPDLVAELREKCILLGPGEVFSPRIPLVLGGSRRVENFTSSQWRMHMHFLGQVHEQVRRLPPGTRIDKLKIEPF